uniref:Uncharacterized protein n=1 Tax=Globodera rostochiensis TaxID=31243 RepID=A0A914GUV1_GLORO
MTILALFAVCNAMREIKRERSYKLYKTTRRGRTPTLKHQIIQPKTFQTPQIKGKAHRKAHRKKAQVHQQHRITLFSHNRCHFILKINCRCHFIQIKINRRCHFIKINCRCHFIQIKINCRCHFIQIKINCRCHFIQIKINRRCNFIPLRKWGTNRLSTNFKPPKLQHHNHPTLFRTTQDPQDHHLQTEAMYFDNFQEYSVKNRMLTMDHFIRSSTERNQRRDKAHQKDLGALINDS